MVYDRYGSGGKTLEFGNLTLASVCSVMFLCVSLHICEIAAEASSTAALPTG